MNARSNRTSLAATTAILVLVLSACGGDSGSSGAEASADSNAKQSVSAGSDNSSGEDNQDGLGDGVSEAVLSANASTWQNLGNLASLSEGEIPDLSGNLEIIDGKAWVPFHEPGSTSLSLAIVDPATRTVENRLDLGTTSNDVNGTLVVGESTVWVSTSGVAIGVNRESLEVTQPFNGGLVDLDGRDRAYRVAVIGDRLFVAGKPGGENGSSDVILELDPATGEVVSTIDLPAVDARVQTISDIAGVGDELWYSTSKEFITRLNPDTRDAREVKLPKGGTGENTATSNGVVRLGKNALFMIDPETSAVTEIELDGIETSSEDGVNNFPYEVWANEAVAIVTLAKGGFFVVDLQEGEVANSVDRSASGRGVGSIEECRGVVVGDEVWLCDLVLATTAEPAD